MSTQCCEPGSGHNCEKCKEVMDLLHAVVDNEATAEQTAYFHQHLEGCLECLNQYQIEKEVVMELKKKIKDVKDHKCCPECVVDTIRQNIKNSTH